MTIIYLAFILIFRIIIITFSVRNKKTLNKITNASKQL